jgi:hypothetical protein
MQGDPHALRLARLEFEYMQRKTLATELKSVRSRCEEVQADIETKRSRLASIGPLLSNIIEVGVLCEQ